MDSQLYYKEAESTRNSDIEDYQEMRSENYNKLENMFKKEDEDKPIVVQKVPENDESKKNARKSNIGTQDLLMKQLEIDRLHNNHRKGRLY